MGPHYFLANQMTTKKKFNNIDPRLPPMSESPKTDAQKAVQQVLTNGTTHFFAFSLIIEGATEKVLQFIMPLKSICNQNLGFVEKICTFEHYREVQTIKNY
jgi:hypothetical protein